MQHCRLEPQKSIAIRETKKFMIYIYWTNAVQKNTSDSTFHQTAIIPQIFLNQTHLFQMKFKKGQLLHI